MPEAVSKAVRSLAFVALQHSIETTYSYLPMFTTYTTAARFRVVSDPPATQRLKFLRILLRNVCDSDWVSCKGFPLPQYGHVDNHHLFDYPTRGPTCGSRRNPANCWLLALRGLRPLGPYRYSLHATSEIPRSLHITGATSCHEATLSTRLSPSQPQRDEPGPGPTRGAQEMPEIPEISWEEITLLVAGIKRRPPPPSSED